MKNIVLFASGTGSNVLNIIEYFNKNHTVKVAAVFTNNPLAGAIQKAEKYNVPAVIFTREELGSEIFLRKIQSFNPSLIVLAGFLLRFPVNIIEHFPQKIINIHPALLPKYGGKGMYGHHVHKAILENKEAETGISIHFVDQHYDNGDLIFQARVPISDCTDETEIAAKVHSLEKKHFPKVIENLINDDQINSL